MISIIFMYENVEIEIQGCGWGVNGQFQLSELFAYPNVEIFGVGQRGSDNRGWTVLICCNLRRTVTSMSHTLFTMYMYITHI